jgi:hypothetical protein
VTTAPAKTTKLSVGVSEKPTSVTMHIIAGGEESQSIEIGIKASSLTIINFYLFFNDHIASTDE